MQWTAEAPLHGFTTSEDPWFNLNDDATEFNVELQSGVPDSILETYRKAAEARLQNRALIDGTQLILSNSRRDVSATIRQNDSQTVLILANLASATVGPFTVDLTEVWPETGFNTITPLLGDYELSIDLAQTLTVESMGPQAYAYLELSSVESASIE